MATEEEVLQDSRIKQEIDISDDPVFAEIDKKDIIDISNVKFEQKELLVKLVRMDSSFKERMKLICPFCSTCFNFKQNLRRHCKSHHKNENISRRTYTCYTCGTFKTYQRKALRSHIQEKHLNIYYCYNCNFTTKSKIKLRKHMPSHIPGLLMCNVCDKKVFRNREQLEKHIVKNHYNSIKAMNKVTSKVYVCKDCSYRTIVKKDIAKHTLVHNRSLNCKMCERTFKTITEFDLHVIRLHADHENVQRLGTNNLRFCSKCSYYAHAKKQFESHMRRIHDLPYVCKKCGMRFGRQLAFESHILVKHDDDEEMMKSIMSDILRCWKCSFKTVRKASYSSHMRGNTHLIDL